MEPSRYPFRSQNWPVECPWVEHPWWLNDAMKMLLLHWYWDASNSNGSAVTDPLHCQRRVKVLLMPVLIHMLVCVLHRGSVCLWTSLRKKGKCFLNSQGRSVFSPKYLCKVYFLQRRRMNAEWSSCINRKRINLDIHAVVTLASSYYSCTPRLSCWWRYLVCELR